MPVILFKKCHVPAILDGTKTVTRRMWTAKRAEAVQDWIRTRTWVKLKTNRFKKEYFAMATILDIREEAPCRMEPEDCAREGYPMLTPSEFYGQVLAVTGEIPMEDRAIVWATGIFGNKRMYRVHFKLVKETVNGEDHDTP